MRTSVSVAEGERLHFWCPGCDDVHGITYGEGQWTWDGDLVNPTITPSILVGGVQWAPEFSFHRKNHSVDVGERTTCHSFVTDGRIQFLDDCTHALAGQTVDLPEWPF